MTLSEGVYAAALTPRRRGVQDINLGVMWELIDFLCARHVQGIVLLGSTGEFVHFSVAERMRMTGLAPRRSRVPVIVNVSHSTLDGAVELAQSAACSGAAAVLLTPPYFFRYGPEAVRSFFLRFAEEAAIPIPVLAYNIPLFAPPVPFPVFADLVAQGAVQGIKDSSGDAENLTRLTSLRRERPFTLMVGNDRFCTAPDVSGIVSGVACAVPELMAAVRSRPELKPRVDEFINWLEKLPVPTGIKEAVWMRGVKAGPHAAPLSPDEERTVEAFREWFPAWLKSTLAECGGA